MQLLLPKYEHSHLSAFVREHNHHSRGARHHSRIVSITGVLRRHIRHKHLPELKGHHPSAMSTPNAVNRWLGGVFWFCCSGARSVIMTGTSEGSSMGCSPGLSRASRAVPSTSFLHQAKQSVDMPVG